MSYLENSLDRNCQKSNVERNILSCQIMSMTNLDQTRLENWWLCLNEI